MRQGVGQPLPETTSIERVKRKSGVHLAEVATRNTEAQHPAGHVDPIRLPGRLHQRRARAAIRADLVMILDPEPDLTDPFGMARLLEVALGQLCGSLEVALESEVREGGEIMQGGHNRQSLVSMRFGWHQTAPEVQHPVGVVAK